MKVFLSFIGLFTTLALEFWHFDKKTNMLFKINNRPFARYNVAIKFIVFLFKTLMTHNALFCCIVG